MKARILTGNCSSATLLLENGQKLYADAAIHDMQKMFEIWNQRFQIVQSFSN